MAKKYHDGAMAKQNKTEPGNVPQKWINEEFPMCDYIYSDYDDTMKGIDENIDNTVNKARRQMLKGKKY